MIITSFLGGEKGKRVRTNKAVVHENTEKGFHYLLITVDAHVDVDNKVLKQGGIGFIMGSKDELSKVEIGFSYTGKLIGE